MGRPRKRLGVGWVVGTVIETNDTTACTRLKQYLGRREGTRASCDLETDPRELPGCHHPESYPGRVGEEEDQGSSRPIEAGADPGTRSPHSIPSRPQATTSPSIARSGRGKGKEKKKVWAKHSRNVLPAGSGWGAGGEARAGRGGRGAARPEPGARTRLGPARAAAWPSRYSGKPSPACGAGRNFPGKSRTPRSAVSGDPWGKRGRRAPPGLGAGSQGPEDRRWGGSGGAPRTPLQTAVPPARGG